MKRLKLFILSLGLFSFGFSIQAQTNSPNFQSVIKPEVKQKKDHDYAGTITFDATPFNITPRYPSIQNILGIEAELPGSQANPITSLHVNTEAIFSLITYQNARIAYPEETEGTSENPPRNTPTTNDHDENIEEVTKEEKEEIEEEEVEIEVQVPDVLGEELELPGGANNNHTKKEITIPNKGENISYKYEPKQGGTTNISIPYINGHTALAKEQTANQFEVEFHSVFPNPNKGGTLFCKYGTEQEGIVYINISNTNGRTILTKEQTVNQGTNTFGIDINTLSKGVYFITISHHGKTTNQRFIVMK